MRANVAKKKLEISKAITSKWAVKHTLSMNYLTFVTVTDYC